MPTTPSNASPFSAPVIFKAHAEPNQKHISAELIGLSFQNKHATAFYFWLNLDRREQQQALTDRYVFYSVCNHVFTHVQTLLKVDIGQSNAFVAKIIDHVSTLGSRRTGFTEEWFRGLHELSCTLTDLNYLAQASSIIQWEKETGVEKFPRIAQSATIQSAYLDALTGNIAAASDTALNFIRKPYLLPDKKELPGLYLKLMYILSSSNNISEYRGILWKGVSSIHAKGDQRDIFAAQIVKTYRGALRALLRDEVSPLYRLPFLLGNISRLVSRVGPLRWLQIHHLIRGIHLAELYFIEFFFGKRIASLHASRPREQRKWRFFALPKIGEKKKGKILVTRAMGGLGDILMMTPGLRALANKDPDVEIHFATQKSFLMILEDLPEIKTLDILKDDIDISQYTKWINLSNCPAGRVEGLQHPNVRRNRIEIFAKAMGISKWTLKRKVGFLPQYQVSIDETNHAKKSLRELNPENLPVIGVQPFAADSYRNWPYMEEFVNTISKENIVLVFHHEDLDGYNGKNIIKIKRPIRESVALAKECNRLVVLDSSFLHFAAALRTPTVVVFGAISGKLRTKNYPNVHLIAPEKKEFPCYPCWRHEHKPCHLTNGRESICFRSLSVNRVIEAVNIPDDKWPGNTINPNPFNALKKWILYGAA